MEGTRDPLTAAEAFRQAITNDDPAMAEANCTPEGWAAPGDGPLSLYRQAVRKRLDPKPFAAFENGDRAAVVALLQQGDRALQDVWLLLERRRGDWLVAGVTKSEPLVRLVLDGVFSTLPAYTDLPPSHEGKAWAHGVLNQLARGQVRFAEHAAVGPAAEQAIEDLTRAATGARAELLGTRALARARRVAVGLRFQREGEEYPEDRWIILDRGDADGALVIHSAARRPSIEALLQGVDMGPGLLATRGSGDGQEDRK